MTAVEEQAQLSLHQLQGELLSLKGSYPQLKLTKTPAGKAADAPFPISLHVRIDAPSAAARYDVDHLDLRVTLCSGILQQHQQQHPAGSLAVAVLNAELPRQLCTRISKQIQDAWTASQSSLQGSSSSSSKSVTSADSFGLAGIFASAHRDFVQLITLLPALVEPYEGTDASGATQRRFAIVEPAEASDAVAAGEESTTAAAGSTDSAAAAAAATANAPAIAGIAAATALTARHGLTPGSGSSSIVKGSHTAAAAASSKAIGSNAGGIGVTPAASHSRDSAAGTRALTRSQQPLEVAAAPAAAAAAADMNPSLPLQLSQLSVDAAPWTPSVQQQQQQLQARQPEEDSRAPHAGEAAGVPHTPAANISTTSSSRASTYSSSGRVLRGRGQHADSGRGPGRGGPQQQQQQQLPSRVQAEQDLATVQRRYGRSMRLHSQQQQQQQDELVAEASAEQQQQQQHAVSQQPQQFSLMLRPTDPLWGAARGPLHVTGLLNPSLYPAAGCVSLSVQPSRGVTAAEVWVLQSALDVEQKQLGGSRQLLSLLKWLENYAGSQLEQFYQAQQQLYGQEQQQDFGAGVGSERVQQQQQQQQQPGSLSIYARYGQHHSTQRAQNRVQQQQQRSGVHPPAASPPPLAAAAAGGGGDTGGIKLLRAAQHQGARQSRPAAAAAAAELGNRSADRWEGDKLAATGHGASDASTAAAAAAAVSGGEHSSSEASTDEGGSSRSSSLFGGSSRSDSDSSGSHSDDDAGSSSEGHPEDEVKLYGDSEGAGGSSAGGYALALEGLTLDNIGVLEVVQAQLQLLCSRCDGRFAVMLTAEGGHLAAAASSASATATAGAAAGAGSSTSPHGAGGVSAKSNRNNSSSRAFEWGGACAVCNQDLNVLLRPRFVHEGSNVLAGLNLQGCRPLDLLPSVYGATCADCDAVGALRALQVGTPASRKCSHCHRTMGCSIPSASFLPRGPPKSGSAAAAGGGSRLRKAGGGKGTAGAAVLQEGSPLPHNGACKHYRHSYRWLRFPCCGQRYACDLCHEEASADGHDAVWANRMVCGFCSREQPLDKACRHCGRKLASSAAQPTGRNTQFWEGGKGCRDIKRLDRRDAHKYRNSKAKTKSAKSKRVGPKPWSGTAAAAAAGNGGNSS